MEENMSKKGQRKDDLIKAGVSGAAYETVQRFGSAAKQHYVSYSGQDNEAGKTLVRIGLRQQAQRSPFCHCEERSDVAIRSLIAALLGNGLPHQSADWFAMTGKLNQADTHKNSC